MTRYMNQFTVYGPRFTVRSHKKTPPQVGSTGRWSRQVAEPPRNKWCAVHTLPAILELFRNNDVQTIENHARIIEQLAIMQKLDKVMGISRYRKENGKYVLPYPTD